MNEPNAFDNPFVDSLRQLAPDVPAEIKSRLLYECGMAAAETKMRRRRSKHLASTMLGLMMATGAGFFFGQQSSQPDQPTIVAENRQISEELPSQPSFIRKQNTTTLAAVMPINRVFELLDRTSTDDGSPNVDLPLTIETPLSTLSFLHELE